MITWWLYFMIFPDVTFNNHQESPGIWSLKKLSRRRVPNTRVKCLAQHEGGVASGAAVFAGWSCDFHFKKLVFNSNILGFDLLCRSKIAFVIYLNIKMGMDQTNNSGMLWQWSKTKLQKGLKRDILKAMAYFKHSISGENTNIQHDQHGTWNQTWIQPGSGIGQRVERLLFSGVRHESHLSPQSFHQAIATNRFACRAPEKVLHLSGPKSPLALIVHEIAWIMNSSSITFSRFFNWIAVEVFFSWFFMSTAALASKRFLDKDDRTRLSKLMINKLWVKSPRFPPTEQETSEGQPPKETRNSHSKRGTTS